MNTCLPRPFRVLALLTATLTLVLPPAVLAETRPFDLGGGVRLELERITKGQFTMGSPEAEAGRNPDEKAHSVTLSRDFYLGRTPVTVAQWQLFAEETGHRSEAENGVSGGYGWNGTALEQRAGFTWKNPGFPQNPDHPVVLVTWEDARQFMKWLGGKTGWTFDFPSEAQWEYACRAGTATAWWAGQEEAAAGPSLWSRESSGNRTHPVTALPANPWGLHISGHVWEWCADWHGPYDGLAETDPLQSAPPQPPEKPRRVLRGGSWLRPLKDTRSAARYRNDPRSRNADNGFRVMSYGPAPDAAAASTAGGAGSPPLEPADRGDDPSAELIDPGDLQPDPASENLSSGPPKTSSGGSSFWVRVLPWGIGALAVLWLLRRMARGSGNPPLPPRLPRNERRPTPPPPLNGPLNLAPGAFLARPVDDGFWLNAGYAAGTWLSLAWQDERGQLRERRVCYEPGEDGHFVYTGAPAERIQVRPDAGGAAGGIPPMPLPLSSPPPIGPPPLDSGANPFHQQDGGRGHWPSAY